MPQWTSNFDVIFLDFGRLLAPMGCPLAPLRSQNRAGQRKSTTLKLAFQPDSAPSGSQTLPDVLTGSLNVV